jgi:hypothetical protein
MSGTAFVTRHTVVFIVLWLLTAVAFGGSAETVEVSTIDRLIQSLWHLAEQDAPLSESDVLKKLEMDPKTYRRDADGAVPGVTYTTDTDTVIRKLAIRDVSSEYCCQAAQSISLNLAGEDCISAQKILASPFGKKHRVATREVHGIETADPHSEYVHTLVDEFYYRVSGEWETTIEINWTASGCTTQMNIKHQRCGRECFQ